MDSKKPNKITQIVRLQQVFKKWKNVANNASKNTPASNSATTSSGSSNKGINKFLKRTLSFTDFSSSGGETSSSTDTVPKGFLAVCVGKELKRFIIPTEYLGHQVFEMLLRRAEEEFGFQQEGVLKIPCQVSVFEKILKVVQGKSSEDLLSILQEVGFSGGGDKDKGISIAPSWSHPYSSATVSSNTLNSDMPRKLIGITNLLKCGPTYTAMDPLGTLLLESLLQLPSDNSPVTSNGSCFIFLLL